MLRRSGADDSMTIGFLHRHVQTVITWPDIPWLISGLSLAALLII